VARSVELFAGAGGMALGMLRAGFEHDQLVELHAAPCEILRTNAARDPALWKSENIRQADVRHWLKERPTRQYRDIDLVAGGPPCQPFSIGGMWAGHADERNMFPVAVDVIRELRPKTFVFENVPGLLHTNLLSYYLYIVSRPRSDADSWPSRGSPKGIGRRNTPLARSAIHRGAGCADDGSALRSNQCSRAETVTRTCSMPSVPSTPAN